MNPTSAPQVRSTANPRRTTLAHLKDAQAILDAAAALPEYASAVPSVTANPRRTVLMVAPTVPSQP
ncbi:hypothetical protein [Streptomyces sp. NPDC060194]|uniref:hypothetical protein n=1 Tax=Streptomyces sp. NPDC060194 TaxID=3347069 RepID=UPI00364CBAF2